MKRLFSCAALAIFASITPFSSALATGSSGDPCEEIGANCRPMTAAEAKPVRERMAALAKALPVPDPARWAASSIDDFVSSMSGTASSMMGGSDAPGVCRSFPGGCFPEETDIVRTYSLKEDKKKSGGESGDILAGLLSEMENRLEIAAYLRPTPYALMEIGGKCADGPEEGAVDVEKTPTFLVYRIDMDTDARLTFVFGPRSCVTAELEMTEEPPSGRMAPVKSVEVTLSGPKGEVIALGKKLDRRAVAALLGQLP